ncbi:acyltransferase [Marinilactibacillus kalidii]|uniref:acyltransferase n=1 Tax=Marinilactibacillus kalidii TaxID=2820274 RepID=UPI001ABEAAC5|nr:acyltransferase [Marinilactibacillus kalidii]
MMTNIKKLISRGARKSYVKRLEKKGLVLGKNVNIQDQVSIDESECWLIEIEDDVVIAPRVIILAHDASCIQGRATKIGRVTIGKKAFIGAGAVILPGVRVGENAVVGAGSVITKSIPDNSIAAGNPCQIIGNRKASEEFHLRKITSGEKPVYSWPDWGTEGGITEEMKQIMKSDLEHTNGYLVNNTSHLE